MANLWHVITIYEYDRFNDIRIHVGIKLDKYIKFLHRLHHYSLLHFIKNKCYTFLSKCNKNIIYCYFENIRFNKNKLKLYNNVITALYIILDMIYFIA